jgi:hypothetical protein
MRRILYLLGLIALAGCTELMPAVNQPPPYPQLQPTGAVLGARLSNHKTKAT